MASDGEPNQNVMDSIFSEQPATEMSGLEIERCSCMQLGCSEKIKMLRLRHRRIMARKNYQIRRQEKLMISLRRSQMERNMGLDATNANEVINLLLNFHFQ